MGVGVLVEGVVWVTDKKFKDSFGLVAGVLNDRFLLTLFAGSPQ